MKLFLDISSTCTGYVLAEESESIVTIKDVGVIWFPKEFTTEDKCYAMYRFVVNKDADQRLNTVVFERYSFNMQNPNGSLVCPQLQGAVMAAASGLKVPTDEITPQTWRSQCGLKKPKGGDWKKIVEAHFRAIYDVPEKIESNVTGNLRTVPTDYFDVLGVCEGYYRKKNYRKFTKDKK